MALNLSAPVQLRAWKQQLLACLPPALAERIASGAISYVLEIRGDSAELIHEGRTLGNAFLDGSVVEPSVSAVLKPHEHPLALMLPVSWVLNRSIALPVAAKENLRQVISFELDRFTPFSADQVYFDFTLNAQDADSDMLSAEVALVPRKRVDTWLELLRSSGIAVDALSTSGLWDEANLLPRELRPKVNWKRLTQRMLPVSLVVILLAAAMALPLWQKREIALSLQAREEALRARSGAILKLRERVDGELATLKEVRDQWRTSPPALDVLQVLTRLLPDDTSLQRMEIKGEKLIINGTSSTASALIALLQNSPAFDSPHFLSPVTQQRGKEVFNLEARINMPFPRDMTGSAGVAPAAQPVKPVESKQDETKPKEPQTEEPSSLPAVGYPASVENIAAPAPAYKPPMRPGVPRSGSSLSSLRLLSGG
jgi:general secretion pathway protein L